MLTATTITIIIEQSASTSRIGRIPINVMGDRIGPLDRVCSDSPCRKHYAHRIYLSGGDEEVGERMEWCDEADVTL